MNPTTGRPRDLHRELAEAPTQWPPSWRPVAGENLVGTILGFNQARGKFGPVRTVLLEKDCGERISVWLSSTVLLGCFQQEAPKVGERIGIRYLGRDTTKGYHKYRLIVDRGPEFSALGGEEIDESPPPIRTTTPYARDRMQPPRRELVAATGRGPATYDERDPFGEEEAYR